MTEYRGARVTKIIRSAVVLTLLAAAAGCAGSAAKVDTRSGGGAGDAAMFAGTWEGTFDASDFSGEMGITLVYESGSYSGSLMARVMDEELWSDIEDFKHEGAEFSCYTFMSDADVYIKGKVEGNRMSGTFQVFVGGEQADEGAFSFEKKK